MNPNDSILKRDEQAIFALRGLYRAYGYLPYKMSRFEAYDLYVRNQDFLISDRIITFADRSGKLLALKPDVTLSIIQNSPDDPGAIQKLYYNENVYREDKATHVIKEIPQTGLECVGDLGSYEIAEVVLLAAKSLTMLGSDYVLDISHMGLIAAVMESCGVQEEKKGDVLRCLRQKNLHELSALCGGLSNKAAEKLNLLVQLSGKAAQVLPELERVMASEAERSALSELRQLCRILDQGGYGESVRIDFSVGNDMKYYSGVVFKGYLAGIPASILSGGQYDKLLRNMGRKSHAIGFALYLDLLERQGMQEERVDTLILHDGTVEPARLIAAAEEASKHGTVLVSRTLPQGRCWKNLVELKGGERS